MNTVEEHLGGTPGEPQDAARAGGDREARDDQAGHSRTVLVTGATRGLGLAITEALIRSNYRVVGAGRRLSERLDALCKERPEAVSFVELDLADSAGLHQWSRAVVQDHGPIYGLVNNAALAHDGVLATLHPTQIEEMLTVNLLGTILLTKAVTRSMLTQRKGRVVNIASIVANTGFSGLSVYAATKAGLVGFSKSLAREVGRAGITVNAIAPGFMETEMSAGLDASEQAKIIRRSPLGRLADTKSVAGAVAYLLDDVARDVTGTVLVVDAGSTA